MVVLHDTTLRRTAPASPSGILDTDIALLTWPEVRNLDVGGGEKLLRLQDFFAVVAASGPPSSSSRAGTT